MLEFSAITNASVNGGHFPKDPLADPLDAPEWRGMHGVLRVGARFTNMRRSDLLLAVQRFGRMARADGGQGVEWRRPNAYGRG